MTKPSQDKLREVERFRTREEMAEMRKQRAEMKRSAKDLCRQPLTLSGNIRPLHDRVVVRRIVEEETGLIVMADVAKKKSRKAEVMAVGPGRLREHPVTGEEWFEPTQVKKGQIVALSPGVDEAYGDIVHEGDMIVVQEADILGVIA